jgi:plasmid replication initiation protein
MTTAKYDFSVYEKRILYRIIETVQAFIEGQKLNSGFTINKDLFDITEFTMPMTAFLNGEEDKNYSRVKKALDDLESKAFYYEDDKEWEKLRIIQMPNVNKYEGIATFKVQPKIYTALLDFSKGFKKYEIATAMSFESTYAMRFYELFSGQKRPITYTIEYLKEIFMLTGKYKQVNDFTKRVIDVAKKELDKKSPYSFEYKLEKTGRKITAITFLPYEIAENKDMRLEEQKLIRKTSPAWTLDKTVLYYLKEQYLFTTKEIQTHQKLLEYASEKIDLLQILANSKRLVEDKKNPKGYLIGIIKKKVNEVSKLF